MRKELISMWNRSVCWIRGHRFVERAQIYAGNPHGRVWYSYNTKPKCLRCGAPNPDYREKK